MTRRFTGWHMTAIMLALFGTIIAVNFIMARFAVGTFSGVVVENSYVAGQNYNRWLAEARAQEALGWTLDLSLGADRRVLIGTHSPDGPLTGAQLTAVAAHPIGREPDAPIRFLAQEGGRFISDDPLPAGRWKLRIEVRAAGHTARFQDEVPA